MNKEEKLHVLQAIDDFLCENDENFDEKDSQVWSDYSNIAVFCFSRAQNRF